MLKKSLIAATAALALAWTAAPASALTFCPSGTGTTTMVGCVQFEIVDQAPGNAWGGATAATQPGADFNVFYQANLGTMQSGTTQPTYTNGGLNSFFTFVLGYQEHLVSNTNVGGGNTNLAFSYSANNNASISNNPADPNFFYMYRQAALGNDLAGTGFAGGLQILAGHTIPDAYSASFNTTGLAPADTIECGAGTTVGCLDQGGVDLGGGFKNNYVGVNTLNGSGSVGLKILIDSFNAAYFPDLPAGLVIVFDTNTTTNIPYEQIDPSAQFSSTGLVDGGQLGVGSVGTINGLGGAPTGCGPTGTSPCTGTATMFQADANSSFVVPSAIPEPATLTLFGIGGLIAGIRRRRSASSK